MGFSFTKVFDPLGGLDKMRIEIFDNDKFQGAKKTYFAMYNPSTFSNDYKNVYDTVKADGKQDIYKFKRTESPSFSVELLLDATEASVTANTKSVTGAGKVIDLTEEVKKNGIAEVVQSFINDLTTIEGNTHKVAYAGVYWGKLSFKGILDTVKVNHTLFRSDGDPIRSKINCTFKSHIPYDEQEKKAKKKSPDLTRFKQIEEQDTLPLISYEVYNDPRFYLELANVNRLNNFRDLRNGKRLRLPPLKK